MEREMRSVEIRLSPECFAAACRCAKDDFEAYYQACLADPFEDHSDDLDRMEEDLALIQALLPAISNEETEFEIKKLISSFRSKIAEVA